MKAMQADLNAITDSTKTRDESMESARRQLRTIVWVTVGVVVVSWALAAGFSSGLDSMTPVYIAAAITLTAAIGGAWVYRNWKKSEEMGALVGENLSPEEREARIAKLNPKVEKGDTAAIMAVAQLQMQVAPRDALATLEKVKLSKANRLMANQVRGMRAMLHLNLTELKEARALVEALDLKTIPDMRARANMAAVKAEAWARTGNPVEAKELLDKHALTEGEGGDDIRIQYLKAYAYAYAHRNDLKGMKKALKDMAAISPNLLAVFLSAKRVHPLLQKEARRRLEQSGNMPRQKFARVRR